jgi:hypothetical protein
MQKMRIFTRPWQLATCAFPLSIGTENPSRAACRNRAIAIVSPLRAREYFGQKCSIDPAYKNEQKWK